MSSWVTFLLTMFLQKYFLILVHRIVSCQSHFFAKNEFVSSHLGKQMDIVSPGKRLSAGLEVLDVTITLGDYKFLSSPMVLGNSDIDLILGMDWLSKHKAQLDCAARQIQLTHSSEDVIVFAARDDTIHLFSLNEKGELDAISQIPVICEYQDVFPEELPGMPLKEICPRGNNKVIIYFLIS